MRTNRLAVNVALSSKGAAVSISVWPLMVVENTRDNEISGHLVILGFCWVKIGSVPFTCFLWPSPNFLPFLEVASLVLQPLSYHHHLPFQWIRPASHLHNWANSWNHSQGVGITLPFVVLRHYIVLLYSIASITLCIHSFHNVWIFPGHIAV